MYMQSGRCSIDNKLDELEGAMCCMGHNRVVIECLCVRVFIYYACIGFNYVVSVFVFAVMFGFRGRRFVSKISVSSQT